MLVGERMTRHPITVQEDERVEDALNLMRKEKVRRLPVLDAKGKLVGIVSEKDLLYASPSPATTLSIYEMHYLLSKLTVKEVMATDFVMSVGTSLRNDNPNARYAFNNVQKMNKGAGLYFHPVGDNLVPTFGKSVEVFTHKVGLEEAALYLILDLFADADKLPEDVKEYLASFKSSLADSIRSFKSSLILSKAPPFQPSGKYTQVIPCIFQSHLC